MLPWKRTKRKNRRIHDAWKKYRAVQRINPGYKISTRVVKAGYQMGSRFTRYEYIQVVEYLCLDCASGIFRQT